MEKQNNNKGVIALLIVIIIMSLAVCVLFATGTISFNSNKVNNDDTNENIIDSDQTNEDNNIETNTLGNNDVFKKLVGTYKSTPPADYPTDECGDYEYTLTIRNDGTADLYLSTCVGESGAKNAIFSINEKQIYLIDKTCEMISSSDSESCTIGGGCYSGGCSPLWTFDYTIDGSNVTIEDLIKQ